MTRATIPSRRQARSACLLAAATVVACAGLLCAAVLAPAPALVIPLVAAVCIGCPMVVGWSVPVSIAVLRATRAGGDGPEALDGRALKALRRHLDRLPETQHPLGL